jgi:hypothetical protein
MLLFALLLAVLGMAAAEQANATKPTSSKDKEKFAYVRIFSAKIPNELDKPLDELEAIARQYGTEEVAMFHKSVGPEKQVDRWIIRQGSEPHAYPPGLTVKARSHLARQKGLGALQMRGRGRATTTLPEQSARLQWVLPESVRSPLLCDIYENDKLVAVNKIHERLSPSKEQRWPNVIHINLPQRDWSIIQVFEYLDEEPEGLASVQQGLYEEPAQELHPTRQIPAKASGSGRKTGPAVESSGNTTIVKTEPASFSAYWPDWGFEWDYDTGWQPRRCPVQVKFEAHTAAKLSSSVWGREFELHYDPDDYNDANLMLTGDSGQGNLEINFGIEMSTKGRVKVDLGLKEVDFRFNIPYAPNFDLRCYDFNSFEGYFIDSSNPVKVSDSVEPQTLFSGPIAGIPSIAEVTVNLKAEMELSAEMWADSITTGPIPDDSNSTEEHCVFTVDCDSCSVTAQDGEYLALANYNEHLEMDMVVSVYPDVCVEVDIWIYDWDYCVSTFAISYKLASGHVNLDFGSRLHIKKSYDLVLSAPYGTESSPPPGIHEDTTEITLSCEPNMDPVPGIHIWLDPNEPLTVEVSETTDSDPNYEFDYWILDGDEIYTTTCSVEFDSNNMFHSLHAVFYRAKATEPFPDDFMDKTGKQPVLRWWPGEYAVSHDVYFGADYNDVNDANTTNDPNNVYMGNQPLAENYYIPYIPPANLGDCNTYYWRIDEVNDSHPSKLWKGKTWCFRTDGCCATKPSPIDGAPDEARNVRLMWEPGARVGDANDHIVYIGTDQENVESAREGHFDDMNNCDEDNGVTRCPLDTNSCNIADLVNVDHLPTTYYWRVDEVNEAYRSRVPDPWKGEVWELTVGHIVVDDFEDYDDTNELRITWRDGMELTSPISGSVIDLETDANYIHGGKQSMEYIYDNNFPDLGHFSQIDANTIGPNSVASTINGDWTTAGVKALVMQFYGEPNKPLSDNERMYVALTDDTMIPRVVECDREANDVNEVNLDLQKFAEQGVDLMNIRRIHIGFGDPCEIFNPSPTLPAGGTGTVWFDDIRLYPPRCRPEMARSAGDFDGDCYVDFTDHAIIANDWLTSNYYAIPEPPLPPNDPNLLVEYTFDPCDAHSGLYDSSGNEHHGIVPSGDPNNNPYVDDGVLKLDGSDFVKVEANDFNSVNPFDGSRDFSIAIVFKTTDPGILISSARDSNSLNHSMAVFVTPTLSRRDSGEVLRSAAVYGNYYIDALRAEDNPLNNQWHHAAVTYDANTNTHRLYLDGAAAPRRVFHPNIPYIEQDSVYIGSSLNPYFPDSNNAQNFVGDVNSVQIYKCVLSPDVICYLANEASGCPDCYCYHPLISPANIVDHLLDYDPSERRTKQVNLRDYKELADNWLEEILWPEEE